MKEVAEFLGHADIRMVEKFYGHLDPKHKQRQAENLGETMEGIPVPPQYHPKIERGPKRTASNPV